MRYNGSLNSNSNYPPMSQSQWEDAPFNQEDPPEKPFDIALSCSLSKDVTIYSNDYNPDGKYGCEELYNPLEAYKEYNHTIPELLNILKDIAKEKLKDHENHTGFYIHKWKQIMEECEGWIVDEENAEQI